MEFLPDFGLDAGNRRGHDNTTAPQGRAMATAKARAPFLRAAYPGLSASTNDQDLEHHDLIVNGSTLGMQPSDADPVDFNRIHRRHLVADAIMEPAMTPLLVAAEAKGCKVFPGKPMLESQFLLMAQHMKALSPF